MRADDRAIGDSSRRDDDRENQGNRGESCDERAAADSPELEHALRLVRRISEIPVSESEIDAARERVRVRVFAAIAAQREGKYDAAQTAHLLARDVVFTTQERPATSGDRVRVYTRRDSKGMPARRSRSPRQAIYVIAAVFALGLIGLLGASQAASAALPGAPLYALKRGEEWIALATAWSDTRRGEVLSAVAHQRLAEARAEAAAGNAAEVHVLMADLNGTMRTLISLTAQMDVRHEDSGVVAAALSRTLADERSALVAALRQGQTVFVQSLSAAAAEQQQAISAAKLALPLAPPGPVPSATGSPPSTPTPSGTPVGSRGSSQGSHSSSGSNKPAGNGPGSSGSGQGQQQGQQQGQAGQHGNHGGGSSGRPHGR